MENGITKRQSAILQGAAIWMMVYHHLYSFAVEYGSLLPFMQVDTVQRIGWFCKLWWPPQSSGFLTVIGRASPRAKRRGKGERL